MKRSILFIILASIFTCHPESDIIAQTSETKAPTATGDDYNSWTDPEEGYISDNVRSRLLYSNMPGSQDYYNFGLSDYTGATITGIEVLTEIYHNNGSGYTTITAALSWDGGATYTSTTYNATSSTGWTDVNMILGNSTALWGRSWSASDFTNANFRVRLTFSNEGGTWYSELDQVRVKVYYTPSGGGGGTGGGGSTPASSIFELNSRLAPGINAYGISTTYITDWSDSYIDEMALMGFKSVRIVSFEPMNSTGFARVKEVVDRILANGMIPIYGQWDHAIFTDSPSAGNIADFVSNCAAIASYFSSYADQDLIIELVNEPNSEAGLTSEQWNDVVASSVAAIRAISPTRPIMVSPLWWGQVPGLDEEGEFVLPDDDNLILSVHYYRLQEFVWQGTNTSRLPWVGMPWYPVQPILDEIDDYFQPLIDYAAANNVPVNIGEFGVSDNADQDSRARFMNYHARYFESLGFSWDLWDFYRDYHVFDAALNQPVAQLEDALINDSRYPDWLYDETTVYHDNGFTTTDGWGASGGVSLSTSGGELVATVSTAGTNPEDRYIQHSVSMTQHNIYRVSFTIHSSRSGVVFTVGGPYQWEYFTLPGGTLTKVFTYMYADASETTYVNFQLGGSTATFYVSDFNVDLITPTVEGDPITPPTPTATHRKLLNRIIYIQ